MFRFPRAAGTPVALLPWQTLRSALGGDSALSAIYDPLVPASVTSAAGNISALADARGGGFGPTAGTLSGTVAFNAGTGALTFTGSNALYTAASALFLLTGPTSLYVIMSTAGTSGGNYFHGLSSNGSATTALVIAMADGTHFNANVDASNGSSSGVAVGATIRLVIVSLDAAGHMNIDVPNHARVTDVSPNPAAFNNALTFGGYFQAGSEPSVMYGAGVIPRVVTAGDITALKAYAATKGYTPA